MYRYPNIYNWIVDKQKIIYNQIYTGLHVKNDRHHWYVQKSKYKQVDRKQTLGYIHSYNINIFLNLNHFEQTLYLSVVELKRKIKAMK